MPINILGVGVKRMGPDSFQWCPVTGQEATGTNWSMRSSVWTWGRTSSLWGWRSTGTGCPEGLWSLLLWRYSRPGWTLSCAACSRWPCFSRGGWTRWSSEVPSNPEHSVTLWKQFYFAEHQSKKDVSVLSFPPFLSTFLPLFHLQPLCLTEIILWEGVY